MNALIRLACIAALLTLRILPAQAHSGTPQTPALACPAPMGTTSGGTGTPAFQPSALWDGRNHVDFEAVSNPKMVPAAKAKFLGNDEYVLGMTVNGESRAYPTRLLAWHHVVNDTVVGHAGGKPTHVSITYCIVCNTGIRYDSVVNGKPLRFDFFGLYNGVMTMYDHDTDSVWLQVSGKAIRGKLAGTTLTRQPLLDTTWRQWKKMHPDTLVMIPARGYLRDYDPNGTLVPRGYDQFPTRYFRRSLTLQDNRLPLHDLVLAVTMPKTIPAAVPAASVRPASLESGRHAAPDHGGFSYRAYPVALLKKAHGVVNDSIESTPVAVFFEPGSETAVALSRVVGGKALTFETRNNAKGTPAFYDRETGTRWSLEGRGESGPLAGQSLARLDAHMSEWYGWVSYFPQTTIYGRQDKPRPVSLRRTPFPVAAR